MTVKLSMNVTTTFHGNVATDISTAKAAGFTGIELQSPKLYRYLDAGYSPESLLPMLEGLEVTGIGAILDLERRGEGRTQMLNEVERMARIATTVGAPMLQMCTGPVDWNVVKDYKSGILRDDDPRYRGTVGLGEQEAISIASANVKEAAAIAAGYGLEIYLEPLAWSNINRCAQALEIIERTGATNVGIALDTWHFWTVGDTLEEVANLPRELIKAVHISDGFDLDRDNDVPEQDVHRNVVIGGGAIPLQQWVDAIKSTGYDGWWVSEMFSDKANEHDFFKVASTMRNLMDIMVS